MNNPYIICFHPSAAVRYGPQFSPAEAGRNTHHTDDQYGCSHDCRQGT
ncbi:hypothetical protein [Proteus mirabilis]